MPRYLAHLGIHPTLSISELVAQLPDLRSEGIRDGWLTFESNTDINQAFLNRLGGTILIAKVVTGEEVEITDVPKILAQELRTARGKIVFSLRFSGVPKRQAQDLYRLCKEELKKRGTASRYVGSAHEPAAAVQLFDEGLLDPTKGCELVLFNDPSGLTVARTIAVQDVKSYTLRDMKKPVRDTSVGLLPPKLAQMLLNFGDMVAYQSRKQSGKKKTQLAEEKTVIFDPFCGTGVIPMEALLRGWSVVASDSAEKAVTGCKKNIEWTYKTFSIDKKSVTSVVSKHDATKPFQLNAMPSVIVTEGTLGPALTKRPGLKEIASLQKSVDTAMSAFIENAAATLPGVPIVLTLPVWYAEKKQIPLEKTWSKIEECFIPTLPPMTEPSLEGRHSMLYRRPDQFVGREIVILKPKK